MAAMVGQRHGLLTRADLPLEMPDGPAFLAAVRRAALVAARTDIRHGTIATYRNHGCRCDACYHAQSEANRRRPNRAKAAR